MDQNYLAVSMSLKAASHAIMMTSEKKNVKMQTANITSRIKVYKIGLVVKF